MISPQMKACMHACKNKFSVSPMRRHTKSPRCVTIKRCTSPKPRPIPGCKWVKTCSPVMGGGVVVSPGRRHHRFHHGRRISPYATTVIGRHSRGRRISPYATTVIGRGRVSPVRGHVRVSPMRRGVVSPTRRVVSPGFSRKR